MFHLSLIILACQFMLVNLKHVPLILFLKACGESRVGMKDPCQGLGKKQC
jgi:hypothetical protein